MIGVSTNIQPAIAPEVADALHSECEFCRLPIPAQGSRSNVAPTYCCLGCRIAADITRERGEPGRINWMLTRLGVAVFLSMAVMMFSMFGYRQQLGGPADSDIATRLDALLRYASLFFATPVLFLLGAPILTNAFEQARRRVISIDGLVIIGVAAAFAESIVATYSGRGETYFETGCAILVFVTLGRWLEARGRLRATDAIESLESMFPAEVEVERGEQRCVVRAADVRPSDLMFVAAGGRIPADGWIESGRAQIDEQVVTGESTPVLAECGDEVRAGTISLDGALQIRATTTGSTSTLGRLIRLVDDARRSRSRFERLSERLASVMVPLTIALAIFAVYLGVRRRGAMEGVMSGLAVLLIACPCALGIATPMAICVAIGRAAGKQILFRDAESLEKLAGIRAVCFDKTGTLTTGEPRVAEFRLLPPCDLPELEALALAAGLASTSRHILSRAIAAFARMRDIAPPRADESTLVAGRGVIGHVGIHCVGLGNAAMMREFGPLTHDADARTTVYLLIDDQISGVFRFEESLRPSARDAVRELQAADLDVSILTGDHHARGESLANELGVAVRAELLPDQKLAALGHVRTTCGPVAMVGDGLNDAPALAAADVGIALGCGADLTRDSAAVCLLADRLDELPWIFRLARQTVTIIRQNLFWAFAYNLVGVGLAITGRLSPVFAAGAMVISSLLVVGNSLRLSRDRSDPA